MKLLDMLLGCPEDTRLVEVTHPLDFYAIELEMHDAGLKPDWLKLLNCETIGDLAELAGRA